jgi:putative flippase GtrA
MTSQNIYQFFRFSVGGLINICSKILLVSFFGLLLVPPFINYLLTHTVILFFSYFYHSKITFQSSISYNHFIKFTQCVMGIKVLDYMLFTASVYVFQQQNAHAVIIASVAVFFLRYLILDKFAFKKEDNNGRDQYNWCDNLRQ